MKKRASDMGDDGKPIDVLREVADRLRTGDDIERRFALGLDAYLEHAAAGMTLGAALGLNRPGGSMMRAAAATQLWAILLACIAAATSTPFGAK